MIDEDYPFAYFILIIDNCCFYNTFLGLRQPVEHDWAMLSSCRAWTSVNALNEFPIRNLEAQCIFPPLGVWCDMADSSTAVAGM